MVYDPKKHHRQSRRLKGFVYASSGVYFITICTRNRSYLFGEISNSEMHLNKFGHIVKEEWLRSAEIRHEIELDAFIIMPNHFHSIVWITNENNIIVRATGRSPLHTGALPQHTNTSAQQNHRPKGPKPRSLGSLVGGFKSICKTRINQIRQTPGAPVWQRNYHDHIIRNEKDYDRIRKYIISNPARWEDDR